MSCKTATKQLYNIWAAATESTDKQTSLLCGVSFKLQTVAVIGHRLVLLSQSLEFMTGASS